MADLSIAEPLPADLTISPPRYRLLTRIGTGGMAEVFLAVTEGSSGPPRPIVVKRLWPELARDQEFVDMFLDEGRLALRLDHPNIVRTHEVGWHEDGYYLAMEYLDGASVQQLVDRVAPQGGLGLPFSLKIVCDVLAGLDYAHALASADGAPLGMVHRDISPYNVLVTCDGAAKLVDFGIAKTASAQRRTRPGVLKGRVFYMAPEQIRGLALDRRADLYAVGVMLWELVSGRRMWAGQSEGQVVRRVLSGMPAPTLPSCDANGRRLAAICARALALDPRDRYSTAAEFQRDVALLLTGPPHALAAPLGALVARTFADVRESMQTLLRQGMPPARVTGSFTGPLPVEPDDPDAHPTRVHVRAQDRPSLLWGLAAVAGLAALASTTWRTDSLPQAPARAAAPPRPPSTPSFQPIVVPAPAAAPPAAVLLRSPPTLVVKHAHRRHAHRASVAEAALARGRQALASGELQRAEHELRDALVLAPDHPDAVAGLAEVQFEHARYREALALARRATQLAPDRAHFHVLVGDACFKLSLLDEAATAYRRAYAIDPRDATVRARLERAQSP